MVKPAITPGKYLLNSASVCLLIVIPVVLFITSLDTIKTRDKVWYGGGYDPEYAYLLNSMNIAELKLVGHFDHPGTPTQVFGGLVLRVTWLFQSAGENPSYAVIFIPEHYLRILTISTLVLAVLMVFVFGLFVLKRSGNLGYALVVQLTPFVSGFVLFNGFTRFTQESMLMIASLGFAVALIDRIINPDVVKDDRSFKILGLIAGFGLASKILFAPLMLIPLIIAKSNKLRKRFIFFSALSFILFTLPIIPLYPRLAYWMTKLFVFTGQYGTGSAGIIDITTYPQNLVWIIQSNPILAGILICGLGYLIIGGLSVYRNRDKTSKDDVKLVFAILVAVVAGYIIIAKSPKEAYLLPYEMLVPVIAIVLLKSLSGIRLFKWRWKFVSVVIAATLSLFMIPNGIAKKESLYSSDKNSLWETSWQAAAGLEGKGGLVFVHPASSPEAALYFGNSYSRWRYTTLLREYSPDTYIYDLASNRITQMDSVSLNVEDLLARHKTLFIIGPLESEAQLRSVLSAHGVYVQPEYYYKDDKQMILLALASEAVRFGETRTLLFSSAETPGGNSDEPLTKDGIAVYGKPDDNVSLVGKKSIITEKGSEYAFTSVPLLLNAGDSICAKVFVKGMLNDARLVIAESDSRNILKAEAPDSSRQGPDEWSELESGFRNKETTRKEVIVYGWNKGNGQVWFDYFSVEIIRLKN